MVSLLAVGFSEHEAKKSEELMEKVLQKL